MPFLNDTEVLRVRNVKRFKRVVPAMLNVKRGGVRPLPFFKCLKGLEGGGGDPCPLKGLKGFLLWRGALLFRRVKLGGGAIPALYKG